MNWSRSIRQTHRWLSMAFTLTVVVALVAAAQESPAEWVFYAPLPPLVLLMLSGLYLFLLPYAAKRRSNRRAVAGS
ncbi:hypothetical protein [Micromonospora musae]|uniref:hypothetical protein n=1 Tax=Micromonospora musae TaxID=1894970 RepID=UPI003441D1C6